MSLDRQDIRAKLDPDVHAALKVICSADGVDLGEFVERIVTREVRERVHVATIIAAGAGRLGISGKTREDRGETKRSGEGRG